MPAQDLDSDPDHHDDVNHTDHVLIQCPICPHNIPIFPSPKLVQCLTKRTELIKEHGKESSQVFRYNVTVCLQIKSDRDRTMYQTRARAQGWPTQLNFRELPTRINFMDQQLQKLINDKDTLERSHSWQTLKGDVTTLREFEKSRALQAKFAERVRPG
jgi:hypothetical protein